MSQAYQVVGLILGFLVSNLAGTGYGLKIAKDKFHLKLDLDSSLRIYVASAVSVIPTLISALNLSSLLNIAIGGSTYLASYLTFAPLIGAVKKSDIDSLSQIVSKIELVNLVIKPIMAYENRLVIAFESSAERRLRE